jgi:hypothetical protein
MQFLKISLYDENDNFIGIEGAYVDGWVAGRAAKYAKINDVAFNSGSNTLPYSGSANIKIRRNNGLVEFLWGSEILVSDINTIPLGRIDLIFGYDPYDGDRNGIPEAYFGKESVDLISISGDPLIPIPTSEYTLKGECGGSQWNVDVSANNQLLGSFFCEKDRRIEETITLPLGPGTINLSATGPSTQECYTSFSYEQYLNILKLECKDGSKKDSVEANFEIKQKTHGSPK